MPPKLWDMWKNENIHLLSSCMSATYINSKLYYHIPSFIISLLKKYLLGT